MGPVSRRREHVWPMERWHSSRGNHFITDTGREHSRRVQTCNGVKEGKKSNSFSGLMRAVVPSVYPQTKLLPGANARYNTVPTRYGATPASGPIKHTLCSVSTASAIQFPCPCRPNPQAPRTVRRLSHASCLSGAITPHRPKSSHPSPSFSSGQPPCRLPNASCSTLFSFQHSLSPFIKVTRFTIGCIAFLCHTTSVDSGTIRSTVLGRISYFH